MVAPRRRRERRVRRAHRERRRLLRAGERVEVAAQRAVLHLRARSLERARRGDVRAARLLQRRATPLRARQQVVAPRVHRVSFHQTHRARVVGERVAIRRELPDDEIQRRGVQRRQGDVLRAHLLGAPLHVLQQDLEHERVVHGAVAHGHQVDVIPEVLERAEQRVHVVADKLFARRRAARAVRARSTRVRLAGLAGLAERVARACGRGRRERLAPLRFPTRALALLLRGSEAPAEGGVSRVARVEGGFARRRREVFLASERAERLQVRLRARDRPSAGVRRRELLHQPTLGDAALQEPPRRRRERRDVPRDVFLPGPSTRRVPAAEPPPGSRRPLHGGWRRSVQVGRAVPLEPLLGPRGVPLPRAHQLGGGVQGQAPVLPVLQPVLLHGASVLNRLEGRAHARGGLRGELQVAHLQPPVPVGVVRGVRGGIFSGSAELYHQVLPTHLTRRLGVAHRRRAAHVRALQLEPDDGQPRARAVREGHRLRQVVHQDGVPAHHRGRVRVLGGGHAETRGHARRDAAQRGGVTVRREPARLVGRGTRRGGARRPGRPPQQTPAGQDAPPAPEPSRRGGHDVREVPRRCAEGRRAAQTRVVRCGVR